MQPRPKDAPPTAQLSAHENFVLPPLVFGTWLIVSLVRFEKNRMAPRRQHVVPYDVIHSGGVRFDGQGSITFERWSRMFGSFRLAAHVDMPRQVSEA